jgi:hypothetical protein
MPLEKEGIWVEPDDPVELVVIVGHLKIIKLE